MKEGSIAQGLVGHLIPESNNAAGSIVNYQDREYIDFGEDIHKLWILDHKNLCLAEWMNLTIQFIQMLTKNEKRKNDQTCLSNLPNLLNRLLFYFMAKGRPIFNKCWPAFNTI